MLYHRLLLACLLALWVAPRADAAPLEDKLKEQRAKAQRIERELKAKRQAIKKVDRQEKSAARELKALEREVAASQRRLAALERQRAQCEADYNRAKAELDRLLPQVGRLRHCVGERLVLLAALGPEGECAALFGEHPSRLEEASLHLERLAEAEAMALAQREADASRVLASQERAETEHRKLAALTHRVAQERAALERKQAEKARLLASLGQQKRGYLEATKRLERSRRELSRLIREVEEKIAAARRQQEERGSPPQPGTGFAALRGKLAMPVSGRVVSRFGERDAQGIAATGVDIEASPGSPITCVWQGRVAYAGMLKGYGNLIVVDHGEGYYSLYGRAARLYKSEGQQVERGDCLGTVAEGAGSLYFEIRHRRKPQDPLVWLAGAVVANSL